MEIAIKHGEENNAKAIVSVCLRIGELRDFVEEITQKYWDYLSEGTIGEGAKIKFEHVAVSAICLECSKNFNFDWHEVDKLSCPFCESSKVELLNGTELEVKDISIAT